MALAYQPGTEIYWSNARATVTFGVIGGLAARVSDEQVIRNEGELTLENAIQINLGNEGRSGHAISKLAVSRSADAPQLAQEANMRETIVGYRIGADGSLTQVATAPVAATSGGIAAA